MGSRTAAQNGETDYPPPSNASLHIGPTFDMSGMTSLPGHVRSMEGLGGAIEQPLTGQTQGDQMIA